MTVDLSKVKAGDKVQIEVPVEATSTGRLIFHIGGRAWGPFYLDPNPWDHLKQGFDIVGHTPAPPPPWVPAVGDKIKHKGSREPSVWAISCIDPDGDWVVKHVKSEYKSVVGTKGQYQFELDNS